MVLLEFAVMLKAVEAVVAIEQAFQRGPTVAFERIVESIDSRPQRMAISGDVSGWIMRSRIGLPYLVSPI